MYDYIKIQQHMGWGEIILNRPTKLNAMSPAMCFEILDAAEAMARLDDIRCIVYRAAGENFSAGYDVATEIDKSSPKRMWLENRDVQAVFERLAALPVVTICELKGYVVGLAMILAATCDLRYAAPNTKFYVPELDMGIPYSMGGVATMIRYVGVTTLANLVLNCVKMPATDVRMATFITEVVDQDAIEARVSQVASVLGTRPQALILSSISTIREAGRSLLPPPASDLMTMSYIDGEAQSRSIRDSYSKRFR